MAGRLTRVFKCKIFSYKKKKKKKKWKKKEKKRKKKRKKEDPQIGLVPAKTINKEMMDCPDLSFKTFQIVFIAH